MLRMKSVRGMSIVVGVLLTVAPDASAQSVPAGDSARGPRSTKDAPSTNGPDIWDANHDGIYTCDEWKGYLDRLFTLADRNRDGHLDPSEFSTIRRAGTAFAEADFGYFDENQDGKITCACRKSNPEILMMQPAQYRSTIDVPYPLNGARYWRVLPHG